MELVIRIRLEPGSGDRSTIAERARDALVDQAIPRGAKSPYLDTVEEIIAATLEEVGVYPAEDDLTVELVP